MIRQFTIIPALLGIFAMIISACSAEVGGGKAKIAGVELDESAIERFKSTRPAEGTELSLHISNGCFEFFEFFEFFFLSFVDAGVKYLLRRPVCRTRLTIPSRRGVFVPLGGFSGSSSIAFSAINTYDG